MNSIDILKQSEKINPSIITIGTFDGMHNGHMSLLKEMLSSKGNLEPVVISFNKSPKEIISNKIPKIIFELGEKIKMIKNLGISKVLAIDFDSSIKNLNGRDFIKILKQYLNLKVLIIGEDTLLGKDRIGSKDGLGEVLEEQDSFLLIVQNKKNENNKISSSHIKQLILDGDIALANSLLGRDYYVSGKVIEGEKIGNKLGFPTANIDYNDDLIIPKDGIYKTITYVNNLKYLSATSIGNNPTFNGLEKTIETYIIDFKNNIYDKIIKINFVEFIRNQIKFNDIDSLKKQMSIDINYIINTKG